MTAFPLATIVGRVHHTRVSLLMPTARPTHYTSSALLSDIKQGRIKIPQFQRDFVWERGRVARLLDSILKGYPLGTFIFWKTQERLRAVRNLGGLALPTPPEGEMTAQVLDGQQRLTSLVAAIEGLHLREDFGAICVDLDADAETEEPVVFSHREQVPAGHTTISFREMLTAGPHALFRAFPAEKHLAAIQRHKDRFNAYPFPAVEISDAPLAVATEIFTRLNVGGRSLTVFEIMVAKTWDEVRGFDLLERTRQIDLELGRSNYGGLDPQLYVQLVAALARHNVRTRDILEMRRAEFIETWPLATEAVRQAVDFCRSDLLIPVRALLPSERLLIPLAYYFHLSRANPAGETKRRLVDLFFRIGLSERYSGTTETRIAQDLRAVREIHEGRLPAYDYGVAATADSIRQNGRFRPGRAYIKTLLCVLASQRPRDFRTGGEVILDNALLRQRNSRNYHHFFPLSFLERNASPAPANHIANITFIGADLNKNRIRAKPPSEYLGEFRRNNERLNDDLESHLIGASIVANDNYAAFFDARCTALALALGARLIPQDRDATATEVIPELPDDLGDEDDEVAAGAAHAI